jgi:hypothetical protein
MSRALQLFSFRGKCSASIYMQGCVQAVAAVPQIGVAEVTCWAVAVVGTSHEMRVYNESTLLSTTALKDHPSGLVPARSAPPMQSHSRHFRLMRLQVFGRFGREDSTALITHKGGSLAIKVLSPRAFECWLLAPSLRLTRILPRRSCQGSRIYPKAPL